MTVLCDFIQIVGDRPQPIPQTTDGAEFRLPDFNPGGRIAGQTGLLIYSAANLAGSAQVAVNNVIVGTITATPGTFFSTQMIAMGGNQLNDGNNEIALRNVTDPFTIKNVELFFHQDSD